jgi:chromosomal replication initiator protein
VLDLGGGVERPSNTSVKILWNRALEPLRSSLSPTEFDAWIRPIAPLSASRDVVELAVPNRLFAAWVEEHFLAKLSEAWISAGGTRARFAFRWDDAAAQGELFTAAAPPPRDSTKGQASLFRREETGESLGASDLVQGAEGAKRSGLVTRYEFTNFVTGAGNQFARAAAIAVARQPGVLYNPFFLFGGVGLGKTHLANAVGNAIMERNENARVLFLSSETFTNRLIDSIARNKATEFKNRMRRVDCLILDDVQFLAGKERTQEEFFHIFNALYESGRQIILTSDKYPHEMKGVEERLCSRFGWGLVADIQPPDVETRIAILERKARSEGIDVPLSVAGFVAERFEMNIRDLEGALTRLSAWASLNRCEITLELAQQLLGDGSPDTRQAPTLEQVDAGITRHFGLRPGDLQARKRTRKVSDARQLAMYIMRHHAGASLPCIGSYLGGRDHSTVVHGCRAVEQRKNKDPRFRSLVETVVRSLNCG